MAVDRVNDSPTLDPERDSAWESRSDHDDQTSTKHSQKDKGTKIETKIPKETGEGRYPRDTNIARTIIKK
jgi:hypothetical protein